MQPCSEVSYGTAPTGRFSHPFLLGYKWAVSMVIRAVFLWLLVLAVGTIREGGGRREREKIGIEGRREGGREREGKGKEGGRMKHAYQLNPTQYRTLT